MSDEWNDDWKSSDHDEADDDLSDLVACPACGEEIYEDAEQCPYCGEYVVPSTSAFAGRPFWFCLLGALGVAATVLCFL